MVVANKVSRAELDRRNSQLFSILFDLTSSLGVFKIIALNAKAINRSGVGKAFLKHVHWMSLNKILLDLSKLYENKKDHEINSLPVIVSLVVDVDMSDNEIGMPDFLQRHSVEYVSDKGRILLKGLLRRKQKDFRKALEQIRAIRNEKIAHFQDDRKSARHTLPTYNEMEGLVLFAIDLYKFVSNACGVATMNFMADRRTEKSLISALEAMGITNLKTSYE
ncbi:MAG: hypothetical protein AB7F75_04665 [Planctomycetota bacterium]